MFRGNDAANYKMDKSNFLIEALIEGDTFNFGKTFLDLPSPDDVIRDIKEMVAKKSKWN